MGLIQLTIEGLSYSQGGGDAYILILKEIGGYRTLPIIIGSFEAQAIAVALDDTLQPPRPLTHDLFKTFANRFDIGIKQVVIHKLVDGVFYSDIICEHYSGQETFDARTSDAIALAIRFQAPIYTTKEVLEKAGISIKTTTKEVESENTQNKELFSEFNLDELKQQLENAVANEDYELAVKLRDEINKHI